jgi:hypothetical protein
MIFSKADGRSPFVFQVEGYRSFFLETKNDYIVGSIPYEWEAFIHKGSILMLAPTVIDRWDE